MNENPARTQREPKYRTKPNTIRQRPVGRRQGRRARPRRPAGLPLQPARRGRAHHQHRRRQHLRQDHGAGPAQRQERRSALGQGLRRRPAHQQARELLLALPGQARRAASASTREADERGPKTDGEDRMVAHVCALHVQPQPAPVVHRHAAARLRPPQARGPHPPQRRHRRGRLEELGAPDARRSTATTSIYTSWQRPGFDLGLMLQDIVRKIPQGQGRHHGPARPDQLGRRRQGVLRPVPGADREGRRATSRPTTRATQTFGGAKYQAPGRSRAPPRLRPGPALAARPGARSSSASSAPSRTTRRSCASSTATTRRAWPSWARAAPTTSCAPRSSRSTSTGTRRPRTWRRSRRNWRPGWSSTARTTPPTTSACKHANSPAMRDPNPTVILIPGLGMIAWGKDKSESRVTAEFYNCAVEVMRGRGGHRRVHRPAAAGGVRHRILAARGGQAPAHAGGEGAGAAGRRGRRRGQRHRARSRAPAGQGRRARGLRRRERRRRPTATAREITDRVGLGIGVAGSGISGCGQAVGVAADITDRRSIRAMLEHVGPGLRRLRLHRRHGRHLRAAGHQRAHRRRQVGADVRHQRHRPLPGGRRGRAGLEAAGADGEPGAHDQRQRGRGKKGSVAYDTSKAAANHLVRELAVELAPLVRVNGVAPATVVQGSAMFPRDRVIAAGEVRHAVHRGGVGRRAAGPAGAFYADRTLTKTPITPADQAEAIFLLLSATPEQDDRPDHHGGRRTARSVPALATASVISWECFSCP